jgi:hypothetical protein
MRQDMQEPKPTSKLSKSKHPTFVWIVGAVFVLCALCFASILMGKILPKRSDRISEPKQNNNPPSFLQNMNSNQTVVKKNQLSAAASKPNRIYCESLKDISGKSRRKAGSFRREIWLDGRRIYSNQQ